MSREFVPASNDNLYNDSIAAALTAYPITISAWVYVHSLAASRNIFSISDTAGTSEWIRLHLLITSGVIIAGIRHISSNLEIATVNALAINEWHHACAVFTATDNWAVYLDGDAGNKGTNATAKTFATGLDRTAIGLLMRSTNANPFDGLIAHVAVWTRALSEAEVAGLAAGDNPLAVQNADLVGYWPLQTDADPEPDDKNNYDMTLGGADHSNTDPAVDAPPGGSTAIPVFMANYRRRRTN